MLEVVIFGAVVQRIDKGDFMMSNITWKYVKKLDDPDGIRSFLDKYHVQLPEKLIKCLYDNNGGRPSEKIFSTNRCDGYVCKSLLSFNKNDIDSIFKYYPDLFFGTSLFPFAMDSSGNFICYDTKMKRYVLWKHETDSIESIKL